MTTFVKVGCGCSIEADFLLGQRRLRCPGGGEVDGKGSVRPEDRIKCEGGKPWVLTARPTVVYDVKPYGAMP